MQPGLRVHHSIAAVPCPQHHLRAVPADLLGQASVLVEVIKRYEKLVLLELRVVF